MLVHSDDGEDKNLCCTISASQQRCPECSLLETTLQTDEDCEGLLPLVKVIEPSDISLSEASSDGQSDSVCTKVCASPVRSRETSKRRRARKDQLCPKSGYGTQNWTALSPLDAKRIFRDLNGDSPLSTSESETDDSLNESAPPKFREPPKRYLSPEKLDLLRNERASIAATATPPLQVMSLTKANLQCRNSTVTCFSPSNLIARLQKGKLTDSDPLQERERRRDGMNEKAEEPLGVSDNWGFEDTNDTDHQADDEGDGPDDSDPAGTPRNYKLALDWGMKSRQKKKRALLTVKPRRVHSLGECDRKLSSAGLLYRSSSAQLFVSYSAPASTPLLEEEEDDFTSRDREEGKPKESSLGHQEDELSSSTYNR